MKPARIPHTVTAPEHWSSMPWGEYYRETLEQQMKPWLAKLYGFHLLKIGNLSAEINTEACAISHQVNVSLAGNPMQVRADPLHLPFAEKSVDACLLAHTLPWCSDPHRLLREADRVLIDDGWMILTGFNPVSLMGLRKLVPVLRKGTPYNSRMFTLMRQLDWLALLNFEVLHYGRYQVLPWSRHGGKLLSTHLPALGCLQLIVARKRTIPLTLNPMKSGKAKTRCGRRWAPPGSGAKGRINSQAGSRHRPVWGGGRRARQLVAAFIFRMAGVALYPFPFNFMLAKRGVQPLPEVDIFHRLFLCRFPAALFPVVDPLGDPLTNILAVSAEHYFAMLF